MRKSNFKRHNFLKLFIILSIFVFIGFGFGRGGGGGDDGGGGVSPSASPASSKKLDPPSTTAINGVVNLPQNTSFDPSELTVRSMAGKVTVDSSGSFWGLQLINEGLSQIVFVENAQGNVIAAAYLTADDVSSMYVTIGPQEMALGLIKLSPYLMVLSADQEELVLARARNHTDFSDLVTDITNALVNAPNNVLDYETYPYIFQKALRIGIEVIASYSGSSQSLPAAYLKLAATVGADE